MRRDVINRDLRHLDKLKLQYPLDHLRRKGSGRMVWARLGEASLRESRGGGGVVFVAPAGGALEAAAASSCRGVRTMCPGAVGVKVGSVGRGGPGRGNI